MARGQARWFLSRRQSRAVLVAAVALGAMMVLFVPLPSPRGPTGGSLPQGSPPLGQTKELDPQFAPVTLSSLSPADGGAFGQSVAVAPSFVVVGAPYEFADGHVSAGHAYIENTVTNTVTELTSPNAQVDGQFGYSVATNGNLVVVGAPGETENSETFAGAAYVFNETGALVASISDPNAQASGYFGRAVAIAGNNVVIGAPLESDSGYYDAGNVYLFDLLTDTIREISSPAPQADTDFGESVSISGSLVAVGQPFGTSGSEVESGNVYVFSFVTGNDIESIANPAPALDALFGYSVAINGSTLVAGAPHGAGGDGIVYQINLGTNAVTTLTSPNAMAAGSFGAAVAVDGVTVLVGAYTETSGGQAAAGNAYLFSQLTGALVSSEFNAPTWPYDGVFGFSVAELGSTVLIGAPNVNASGLYEAGQAYVFSQIPLSLVSPNAIAGGQLGASTSISQNWWATGAPDETSGGLLSAGNVYVVPVLSAPIASPGSLSVSTYSSPNAVAQGRFGFSVAVNSGYLAIGAPGETAGGDARAGHVYVYDIYDGDLFATLTSPSPQVGGLFGSSVAVSASGAVLVGAPGETASSFSEAGNAYVFFARTGSLEATLTSLNPVTGGQFGTSVGIWGSEAVVGAPYETADSDSEAGHVYLFNWVTSSSIATLSSPNSIVFGTFGASVSVSGVTVVVGAPGEEPMGLYNAGRAYLYNENGVLLATLESGNPAEGGSFGDAVSTDGVTVVVGAPNEEAIGNPGSGNVYIFSAGGAILDRYYSPDAQESGYFGASVFDGANHVVVGAPYEGIGGGSGSPGENPGHAYVFGFEPAVIDP